LGAPFIEARDQSISGLGVWVVGLILPNLLFTTGRRAGMNVKKKNKDLYPTSSIALAG
jgi:hypothetical protein